MAKTSKRPAKAQVGDWHVRVMRGPHKDNPGSWYWLATRYHDGAEANQIIGWATREDAIRTASGWVVNPDAPSGGECRTVRDLLELFLGRQKARTDLSPYTVTGQKISAKKLDEALWRLRVEQVTARVVEDYVNRRLQTAASSSVRQEMVCLSAAWRWAKGEGLLALDCPARPKFKVRPSAKRNRYTPDQQEIALVLRVLEAWARMALWLYAATGCRLGELDDLRRKHVSLRRGTVTVIGKREERIVALAPPVVEALDAYLKARADAGYPGPEDHVWPVSRQTMRSNLRRALTRGARAAGVPAFSPHALRRAAVDEVYGAPGADPAVAGKLLGHSATMAVRIYRTVREGQKAQLVESARMGYFDPLAEDGRMKPEQKTRTGAESGRFKARRANYRME